MKNRIITTEHGQKMYVTQYFDESDLLGCLHAPHIEGRLYSSNDTDSDWSGAESYEDAEKLMIQGDDESYSYLREFKTKTDRDFVKYMSHKKGKRIKSVAGFEVNVPAAIRNVPKSMYRNTYNRKPVKVVRVFFNRGFSWNTPADDIRLIGASALSAIEYLESIGKYRFEIWVGDGSLGGSEEVGQSFATCNCLKLKDFDRPLNLYRLAFYLVNPAFLRRIIFRIDETNDLQPDLGHGYGRVWPHDNCVPKLKAVMGNNLVSIDDSCGISMRNSAEQNFEKLMKIFNSAEKSEVNV